MKELFAVSVSKTIIFNKIRLFTSYLAGKRAAGALEYDRVAAIELDIPLLTFIAEDVASDLASRLANRLDSFSIEDDVIRFVLVRPSNAAYGPTPPYTEGVTLVYNLIESCILAGTILNWLKIAGYKFTEGDASLRRSAEEVLESKRAGLLAALDPDGRLDRKRILIAAPRRISPI